MLYVSQGNDTVVAFDGTEQWFARCESCFKVEHIDFNSALTDLELGEEYLCESCIERIQVTPSRSSKSQPKLHFIKPVQ